MSLIASLKKAIKRPLSNEDIKSITKGKCKVMKYEELRNFMTLDSMFKPYKAVVILYETEPSYGHWVAMLKEPGNREGVVEFFDSYGMKPDSEIKFVPAYFRKISGQNKPILTWLIESSPYRCEWNQHDFQSKKREVNSCGRWAAVRVAWRDVTLAQFQDFFISSDEKYPSDVIISALTLDH
jgi:hypothetical protein